jgi:thiamine-phosphate pyrophosphorylase
LILSQSVHATEEIENVDSDMDYIFLGPIFESLSKMDHTGRFDLRELTHFLKAYSGRLRIYALSGITESRIKEIREMGFHGCAVLGRIWNTFSTSGESATLKTFNTLHLNTIHARNN